MRTLPLPHLIHAGRFEGADVRFHKHGGHELIWVMQGECRVRMNGQRFDGREGTIFVVPQGVQHNQEASFVRTSYMVFQLTGTDFDTTPRTLKAGLDTPARRWLDDLYDLSLATAPPSPNVTGALILALLESLVGTEDQQNTVTLHPALEAALSWMQARLDSPLKVQELSAHTHFSSSHLSELFHRQFGCGPHGYHQKLRLEQAARLLNNPYLRVAEVGRTCGYEDANYFARQFQRHHGLSPAAYRRERYGSNA